METEYDASLVRETLNGDKSAFGTLYDRYARIVRAICFDTTRDVNIAQELAQEAFLRAFTKLPKLRRAERFGPWLVSIARHVCPKREAALTFCPFCLRQLKKLRDFQRNGEPLCRNCRATWQAIRREFRCNPKGMPTPAWRRDAAATRHDAGASGRGFPRGAWEQGANAVSAISTLGYKPRSVV